MRGGEFWRTAAPLSRWSRPFIQLQKMDPTPSADARIRFGSDSVSVIPVRLLARAF